MRAIFCITIRVEGHFQRNLLVKGALTYILVDKFARLLELYIQRYALNSLLQASQTRHHYQ